MEEVRKLTIGGEMTPAKVQELLAQKRTEAAAKAQQQIEAGNEPAAAPEATTIVAAEPAPQPEPVAPVVSISPQEPAVPEVLSTTVEFTNQELLEFLKGRAGMTLTTGDLSPRFKITPELAAEIIRDLQTEQCVDEKYMVVSVANIEAIEAMLRHERTLNNKFIHIPPKVETSTLAPDLSVGNSPKTIKEILSHWNIPHWLDSSKYLIDQTPEERAASITQTIFRYFKDKTSAIDTMNFEVRLAEKELQDFNEYIEIARNVDFKTDATLDADQRSTFHDFLNAESQIRSYLEKEKEAHRIAFEKISRLTPGEFLEMEKNATQSEPVVKNTKPTVDLDLTPTTSPDIDLNVDEPTPVAPTTPTSIDIDINDLEAATPTPPAIPTEPKKIENPVAAPVGRASVMTERLFKNKIRVAIAAGILSLGALAVFSTQKSTRAPEAGPTPAVKPAKPAPEKAAGGTQEQKAGGQQAKQEALVAVTKAQLLEAGFPEAIHESVTKILAQPNAKDFIMPFLQEAKKLQTSDLVPLPESARNDIFNILTKESNLLNMAWSGKAIGMSECLVNVNNTTCDLQENFSKIAKSYRDILQETSNFPRLHDAPLPEKNITDMHAYVRAEIQAHLAKQAVKK